MPRKPTRRTAASGRRKPAARKATRKTTGKSPRKSAAPLVGIVMGSQSDWDTMRHTAETLKKLKIPCEVGIHSAHRTPDRLADFARGAKDRGLKVIIAGAGMAAALPGVVAAMTPLPVFGVPMEGRVSGGLDAILAMVQMPGGIPVGTLALGRAGAVNAALLAAAVLALGDNKIEKALDRFRADQTKAVPVSPS